MALKCKPTRIGVYDINGGKEGIQHEEKCLNVGIMWFKSVRHEIESYLRVLL